MEYQKSSKAEWHETAFGALINKKSICSGFAAVFKLLMNMKQIRCLRVSGTAWNDVTSFKQSQETHQWNCVEINSKWTNVDVTWNS